MQKKIFTVSIIMTALSFSCQNSTGNKPAPVIQKDTVVAAPLPKPWRKKVLTAAEQQALTPDMVIATMKAGNQR